MVYNTSFGLSEAFFLEKEKQQVGYYLPSMEIGEPQMYGPANWDCNVTAVFSIKSANDDC
jgi:hypothetical protein